MIYSKTSEYAIRSLVCFVGRDKEDLLTVKEVSQKTKVPQAYVAKIFQCLVDKKILKSQRGPKGGFLLLIEPKKLHLMDLIKILDSSDSFSPSCIMGLEHCRDSHPCPLHEVWSKTKKQMIETLNQCTIEDVAKLSGRFSHSKRNRKRLSNSMRQVFITLKK